MITELLSPFDAEPCATPALLLADRAHRAAPHETLARFAYAIAPAGADTVGARQFMAERYGGLGIRSNGGGARCGIVDGWLVKGMGCNQLLGEGLNFWSSHGSLPLSDAVAEYAWTRLLDEALPFGAVAASAVIATGAPSWTRGADGARRAVPGALLVRQATYRLASFERALYFRPVDRRRAVGCPDVARVRAALAALPQVLPVPAAMTALDYAALPESEKLHHGLVEAIRRYGAQFAAASAKRIMHGSMASSNIALDGRWLDLGSITGLPRFGIRKIFRPSFWAEYTRLTPGIDNIVYYLHKYSAAAPLAGLTGISHNLRREYYHALRAELVIRCGFPADAVRLRQALPAVAELGALLVELAQAGTSVDKPAGPEAAEHIGRYAFGPLVWALASSRSPEERLRRLLPQLGCDRLAGGLADSYGRVDALMGGHDFGAAVGAANFRRLCGLRAAKAGRDIDWFSRPALNRHLQAMIGDGADAPAALGAPLRQLVGTMADQGAMVLRSGAGAVCTVWRDGATTVDFDARDGGWVVTTANGIQRAGWAAIFDDAGAMLPARAVRQFWGSAVFEALT